MLVKFSNVEATRLVILPEGPQSYSQLERQLEVTGPFKYRDEENDWIIIKNDADLLAAVIWARDENHSIKLVRTHASGSGNVAQRTNTASRATILSSDGAHRNGIGGSSNPGESSARSRLLHSITSIPIQLRNVTPHITHCCVVGTSVDAQHQNWKALQHAADARVKRVLSLEQVGTHAKLMQQVTRGSRQLNHVFSRVTTDVVVVTTPQKQIEVFDRAQKEAGSARTLTADTQRQLQHSIRSGVQLNHFNTRVSHAPIITGAAEQEQTWKFAQKDTTARAYTTDAISAHSEAMKVISSGKAGNTLKPVQTSFTSDVVIASTETEQTQTWDDHHRFRARNMRSVLHQIIAVPHQLNHVNPRVTQVSDLNKDACNNNIVNMCVA